MCTNGGVLDRCSWVWEEIKLLPRCIYHTHTHHLFPQIAIAIWNIECAYVCVQINGLLPPFASEPKDAGIKPLIPLPSNQRKGAKAGDMECVMGRYKVPEEKKWTRSLMRTLTLMQMGIDYRCRSVRRYLTLTGGECVCVCLRMRGHGCVFIFCLSNGQYAVSSIFFTCHFMNSPLIILLSALMDFWCFGGF